MAKTRVSELAKKYGIPSKEALEKLGAIGEFAKTASSSIELPAVKKFEDTYGAELTAKMKPAEEKADKPAAPAMKAAPARARAGVAPARQEQLRQGWVKERPGQASVRPAGRQRSSPWDRDKPGRCHGCRS